MHRKEKYQDEIIHHPSQEFVKSSNVYDFMSVYNIPDMAGFRDRTTSEIDWFWDVIIDYLDIEFYEEYDSVRDDTDGPQFSSWYPGGRINIAHNVLDRYGAPGKPTQGQTALIHEAENRDVQHISFGELYRQANQVANTLESHGIESGDAVGVYMPNDPHVAAVFYGCFKLGAVAVPLFSGFGVEAVATRLDKAACSILFTADGFYRRGKPRRLAPNAVEAAQSVNSVERIIATERLDEPMPDIADLKRWDETVGQSSEQYSTKSLPSDAESMILFTSGTTGSPKGTIQTHAGQLIQCAKEIYFAFDHKPEDRFFWITDMGWIMGPWSLIGNHVFAGTVLLYDGAPDHPKANRYWDLIDRHEITVFGISPSGIRTLREPSTDSLSKFDLNSLRLLGSTGEPWDVDSWLWFYHSVGDGEIPIINITGGTEICGCFLMPMPTESLKPCTVGRPSPGMDVDIVNDEGKSVTKRNERGFLIARDSCPSMTNGLVEGDDRYIAEYWSQYQDCWDHSDWAQRDKDGFWFLHGRADDVLTVAGRRVGPAEVEDIANGHERVRESAAIGVPDEISGESIALFISPFDSAEEYSLLQREVCDRIQHHLGKPFIPTEIETVKQLPKNQNGKILRSVIRQSYLKESFTLPETITNPETVQDIMNQSK